MKSSLVSIFLEAEDITMHRADELDADEPYTPEPQASRFPPCSSIASVLQLAVQPGQAVPLHLMTKSRQLSLAAHEPRLASRCPACLACTSQASSALSSHPAPHPRP